MDYQILLHKIKERYLDILRDNLIGIYIHGSIALGSFDNSRSDIDFIVVVESKLSTDVKLKILEVLENLRPQAPPKGFEMSIVLKEYCVNFKYPTPYELHFSNSWLERYLENPLQLCDDNIKTDKDLAAHFTIIKYAGIVLYGLPIADLFGEVSKKFYIDSLQYDIENAKTDILNNSAYVVLSLCRVYAYLKSDLILSKNQGGEWGMLYLPREYYNIIACALNGYMNSAKINLDKDSAIKFCDYMLNEIYGYALHSLI
jgi:predicted nucleotidyltransferase